MAVLTPDLVSWVVAQGATTRVSNSDIDAKFSEGDSVVMKNTHPRTHTRLARYLRGKRGVVTKHHGVFHFNDAAAHGEEVHQNCYAVKFSMSELWGEGYKSTDYVHVDMFDEYMERI